MPVPQRVPNPKAEPTNPDVLARRWGIECDLARRIIQARGEIAFELWIFSGARTRAQQEAVSGTPFSISTHANSDAGGTCARLATGADVQPSSPAMRTNIFAAQMGAAMVRAGLRWGGGASVDPTTGIPKGNERWHVDLGSRPT